MTMLPSSVRRVIAAAPPSPAVSSLVSSAPRAGRSFALCCRPNAIQRRYSSSKPSKADDGATEFSARQSPPSEKTKKSGAKSTGDKRKRKTDDASQLPSVPPTVISPEALGLSTFFSLHRPISVTHSFPKTITDEKFAEIFAVRGSESRKPPSVSDVLSTLNQTVQTLERRDKFDLDGHNAADSDTAPDGTTHFDLHHPDGSNTSVYLQLDSMAGHFVPFRPPPLPRPVPSRSPSGSGSESAAAAGEDANASAAEVEATAPAEEQQTRKYKVILTIEEQVDHEGQFKVLAHSPQLIEEGQMPRSFLERMALRQATYEEARQRAMADNAMYAISVRRQRKLKMKKKKYKKLMRRTRNERRKLQRL